VLDSLSSLAGPVAYLVVAVLAALEASAFVGLFIPGELALLTGGYIAHQGNASLADDGRRRRRGGRRRLPRL